MSLRKSAFTLIELLVVIAIIAILISILTSSFLTAQKQTRDSRRKTDLEQIRQSLETYRSENGTYPSSLNSLTPNYITNLPSDPSTNRNYAYIQNTSANYSLCASLELPPTNPANCGSLNCGIGTCNYLVQQP